MVFLFLAWLSAKSDEGPLANILRLSWEFKMQ